jgi:CBS domain-containing protein
VVDNDQRLEGLLTRDHLIRGLSERGPGTTVGQVMATPVQSIGPAAPFDRALEQLRASGLPALSVVDETRRVVGLITMDNIADLILVRRHMPART